jgi:hypothetical protein
MIQIKQQERSFLRRVNVLKPFINENCPSSRRAYFLIPLAVKTSRPHFGNLNKIDCKYITKFLFLTFFCSRNFAIFYQGISRFPLHTSLRRTDEVIGARRTTFPNIYKGLGKTPNLNIYFNSLKKKLGISFFASPFYSKHTRSIAPTEPISCGLCDEGAARR